jgi:hypothetical protein
MVQKVLEVSVGVFLFGFPHSVVQIQRLFMNFQPFRIITRRPNVQTLSDT